MTPKRYAHPRRSVQKPRAIAPPLATAQVLKEMYSRMLRSRAVAGAMSDSPSCSEAVTAGIGLELKPTDALCAGRCQLLQYVASLARLTEQHATWLKLVAGAGNGALPLRIPEDGPAVLFPDSDGRAQMAVAIGTAHAFRAQGQSNVCVVLAGSLASGLLSAYDAARFAAEAKLPVVFAFETHLDVEHPGDHAGPMLRAEDLGFPRIPVDGNDSVAVHRVATEAIQRARQGDGPTLIECQIARSPENSSLGLAQDPVVHMRYYLQKHQLWSDDWNASLEEELRHVCAKFLSMQHK